MEKQTAIGSKSTATQVSLTSHRVKTNFRSTVNASHDDAEQRRIIVGGKACTAFYSALPQMLKRWVTHFIVTALDNCRANVRMSITDVLPKLFGESKTVLAR